MKRIKIRSHDCYMIVAKVLRFDDTISFGSLIESIVHKLGLSNDFDRDQDIEKQFELWLDGNNQVEGVDEIDNGDDIVLFKKKTRNKSKKVAKATTITSTTKTTTKSKEYDAVLPVTKDDYLLNFGQTGAASSSGTGWSDYPVFLGYRRHADGSRGLAELGNLIHGIGDKLIAVGGTSIADETFTYVMALLKACAPARTQKPLTLRFQKYKGEEKRQADAKQKGGGDEAENNDGNGDDDSNVVEDVTKQCLEERASKRKIIDLSDDL